MNYIFNFYIFLFGLIIGSFLNSVIYRLERDKSLGGRSYCPNCKHELKWIDLFPVFSYIFLKGNCKYCNKKISIQYPLVEIATGLMFLLIFNHQLPIISLQDLIALCFMFYISCSMITIFVYDLKYFIIPDKVLLPAIVVTFLYQLFLNFNLLILNYFWAGLISFLFFWIIFFISNGEWMGFGDCKLVVLLGLLLGFPNILIGLFLSFFFGAIIGLIFIFSSISFGGKVVGLKSQIPFAPFLILGMFVAMFWGQQIISWYLNFLIF